MRRDFSSAAFVDRIMFATGALSGTHCDVRVSIGDPLFPSIGFSTTRRGLLDGSTPDVWILEKRSSSSSETTNRSLSCLRIARSVRLILTAPKYGRQHPTRL